MQATTIKRKTGYSIKSPLNYIGGKTKILPQILPLFPKKINTFLDLFTGGVNVSLNVQAEKFLCNDNLSFLIEMYQKFQLSNVDNILKHIESQIDKFQLSTINEEGYKSIREHYNTYKNPLDLFILIAFSFNHQIRFNNSHKFNNPFGRERSSFNKRMRDNLIRFINHIQNENFEFTCFNFEMFDFGILNEDDFVYCDPPYLISLGTYNDGKRGFIGWNEQQELKLLSILEQLHQRNIPFALSNVLYHKGQKNEILINWINSHDYLTINYINADYRNSNYQTLKNEKNTSVEVLITNYKPINVKTKTLFD